MSPDTLMRVGPRVTIPAVPIPWNEFEFVGPESADAVARGSEVPQRFVVYLHGLTDCYRSLTPMHEWKAASEADGIPLIHVVHEESGTLASRYLRLTYPEEATLIDTSGWLREAFDITRTPAVLLVSGDVVGVALPETDAKTDDAKRALVQWLRSVESGQASAAVPAAPPLLGMGAFAAPPSAVPWAE